LAAIRTVHQAAFGGEAEALLVERLEQAGALVVSLAAVDGGRIVGHVAFSPVAIKQASGKIGRALGLAPLAVLPAFQRRGIGARLVRAGLDRCRELGEKLVFVVGDPAYYRRFGFEAAAPLGLHWERGGGKAFQVLCLHGRARPTLSGEVSYHPAFDDL
jgi:putative acetyltransferase